MKIEIAWPSRPVHRTFKDRRELEPYSSEALRLLWIQVAVDFFNAANWHVRICDSTGSAPLGYFGDNWQSELPKCHSCITISR